MGVKRFIWDEVSDNVLLETDETDTVTARYCQCPERFGELLFQDRSGTKSFFHYDGNASTCNLTDSSEAVTDTTLYTAYGEEVSSSGSTTNPFGYKGAVGYYTNDSTGGIYARNRSYEPTIGRWLSKDPLGFVDGTSLYRAYFVPGGDDPYGLACQNKCVVKNDFGSPDVKPCLFVNLPGEDEPFFVLPFTAKFEFDDVEGECSCCEYRQLKLLSKKSIVFKDADGNETECLVQNDFWWNPLRDDNYGYRSRPARPPGDQYLPNQATGCTYVLSDTPGLATDTNIDECFRINPGLRERAVSLIFKIEIVFFLNIIDFCAEPSPTVVWTKRLDGNCESEKIPL